MSTIDKRRYAERIVGTEQDTETVRIFAFTNRRPRYEVVFSPERPLIILKTKSPSQPQHPCMQWVPFSSVVFTAAPNTTEAVYVMDAACLKGPEYRLEESPNLLLGPMLKKLRNAVTKLNPHNACLIAAGASSFMGLKYVLVGEKTMGHRDRLVECVALLCPGPAPSPEMEKLCTIAAAQRDKQEQEPQQQQAYPLPCVRVLVRTRSEEEAWRRWLRHIQEDLQLVREFRVDLFEEMNNANLNPSSPSSSSSPQSLFHALAKLCDIVPDGTPVDESRRFLVPVLYRLDFFLSRQTKTVVQIPKRSPLNTLGYDNEDDDEEEEVEEVEEEEEACEASPDSRMTENEAATTTTRNTRDDGNGGDRPNEVNTSTTTTNAKNSSNNNNTTGHHHLYRDPHHMSPQQQQHHDHDHHPTDNDEDCCDSCEEEDGLWEFDGLTDFASWRSPGKVILEGRVLAAVDGRLGTTQGVALISNLQTLMLGDALLAPYAQAEAEEEKGEKEKTKENNKKKKKAVAVAVRVEARVHRNEEGRTSLIGTSIQKLTKREEAGSLTVTPASQPPPPYTPSNQRYRAGALIIRGRKCALVRLSSSSAAAEGENTAPQPPTMPLPPPLGTFFTFPSAAVCDAGADWLHSALDAACEACDCSSDNFYVPHFVPPSVIYTKRKKTRDTSSSTSEEEEEVNEIQYMYVIVTSAGPPGGASTDAVDDDFSPHNEYEWLSFDQALYSLAREEEREALVEMRGHIQRAYHAGLYRPAKGCGVFGDPVPGSAFLPPASSARSACDSGDAAKRRIASVKSVSFAPMTRTAATTTTEPPSPPVRPLTQQVICTVCPTKQDRRRLLPAMKAAMLTHRVIGIGAAEVDEDDGDGGSSTDTDTDMDTDTEEEDAARQVRRQGRGGGGGETTTTSLPSSRRLLYSLDALANEIRKTEGPAALIVLGETLDGHEVFEFCRDQLGGLATRYAAKVFFYAVIGPCSGRRLLSCSSSGGGSGVAVEGGHPSPLLDRWLELLPLADAVLLSEPLASILDNPSMSSSTSVHNITTTTTTTTKSKRISDRVCTEALLDLCRVVDPEVTILEDFNNPRPLAAPPPPTVVVESHRSSSRNSSGAGLRCVDICSLVAATPSSSSSSSNAEKGMPLPTAVWNFLQEPESLGAFYGIRSKGGSTTTEEEAIKGGEEDWVLVWAKGVVRETTRTHTTTTSSPRALLHTLLLDGPSHCLSLADTQEEEEGGGGAEEGAGPTPSTTRSSTSHSSFRLLSLMLCFWCPAAAATEEEEEEACGGGGAFRTLVTKLSRELFLSATSREQQ